MAKKLLVALAFGGLAALSAAQQLSVVTTSKPDNCDSEGTRKSQPGDSLSMHYTGTIDQSSSAGEKGKQFDSSIGRGPFSFKLGAGEVIKGWDEGLKAMCVGEKRTLVIPASMGYGDQGAGQDIPGGATLKFTVELLAISDGGARLFR
jgi:FKBP-type peptidyl-prolyl cis-trans isomerase